ncbi:hypothetical protein [Streptomyces sp. NPDC001020]
MLKTPTGNLATNGGSQHLIKRKVGGGHGPNLADEVEWLLPTPKASDGTKGSPNQRHGNGDLTLPSAAARLRHAPDTESAPTTGRHAVARPRTRTTQALALFEADGPRRGVRTRRPSPGGSG